MFLVRNLAVAMSLIAILGSAGSAVGRQPGGRRRGKVVSPGAIEKANERIREIARDYGKDLLIDTVPGIPIDLEGKYKEQGKQKFFNAWAEQRATGARVKGIYVLLSKQPGHLQIEVDKATRQKAFTTKDRDLLVQKMLPLLRIRITTRHSGRRWTSSHRRSRDTGAEKPRRGLAPPRPMARSGRPRGSPRSRSTGWARRNRFLPGCALRAARSWSYGSSPRIFRGSLGGAAGMGNAATPRSRRPSWGGWYWGRGRRAAYLDCRGASPAQPPVVGSTTPSSATATQVDPRRTALKATAEAAMPARRQAPAISAVTGEAAGDFGGDSAGGGFGGGDFGGGDGGGGF